MKHLILASTALFLVACGAEPGSEKWCAEKDEQSKAEWSAADAGTYAGSIRFSLVRSVPAIIQLGP